VSKRTFKRFETAPRDGTPFHVATTVRFNPLAKRFESLYRNLGTGEVEWVPDYGVFRATRWCDLLPLPYELPKWFAVEFVATAAKATPTRSAKTTKIGLVRRMVARCRKAFAQMVQS
jgi:hypothetical protein